MDEVGLGAAYKAGSEGIITVKREQGWTSGSVKLDIFLH